jgi:hypothetical protein
MPVNASIDSRTIHSEAIFKGKACACLHLAPAAACDTSIAAFPCIRLRPHHAPIDSAGVTSKEAAAPKSFKRANHGTHIYVTVCHQVRYCSRRAMKQVCSEREQVIHREKCDSCMHWELQACSLLK